MNLSTTTSCAILVLLILALTVTAASAWLGPNTDLLAATLFALLMIVALLGSIHAVQPRSL